MSISTTLQRTKKLLSDNSPALLASAGIAGTVAVAILSGHAGYRAGYSVGTDEAVVGVKKEETKKNYRVRIAKQTWKLYIPAAVTGVGTVTAIAMSNRISTGRTAALAAAYTITDRAFSEYQAKAVEVLGEKKEQTDIRDKIAQDQINSTGDRGSLVVLGSGEVLCYDPFTDRYFNSTMEKLKKAMNDTNYQIINNMYVSLSEFYDKIGLPKTAVSDELGWNSDNLLDLHFSTVMTPDDKPALSYTFHVTPFRDYYKAHGPS